MQITLIRLNIVFNTLVSQMKYSGSFITKEKVMINAEKVYENALRPLIGKLTYVGSDKYYHVYHSKTYGILKMSKLVFEESHRFPNTVKLLSKHPLFIGEYYDSFCLY